MLALIFVAHLLEPSAVRIEWDAPAACPDAAEIERRLGARLQRVPDDERKNVGASAHVREEDGAWVLELDLATDAGVDRRRLVLDSCEAAAEAAVLVTGLAISPSASVALEVPTIEPPPPEPIAAPAEPIADDVVAPRPASQAPAPTPTIVEPPARPRVLPRGAARLLGGGGFGVLAPAGGQLALELGAQWPRWQIGVRVDHWFARSIRRNELDGGRLDLSLTSGSIFIGPAIVRGRWRIPFVALVEVGGLHARGRELPRNATKWLPFVALGAGVAGLFAVQRWLALGLSAELVVPLVRHELTVAPVGVVRHTGPIGGRLLAAVELRFGGGARTIR